MKSSTVITSVGLGVFFWFNAAMIIHFFGASVFTEGNSRLPVFFLLAVPITLVSMYLTKVVLGIGFSDLVKPVVIMTTTATFLDGIALSWFRKLYNDSFEVSLHGAAWILWGAGLGLFFSYYFEIRNSKVRSPA